MAVIRALARGLLLAAALLAADTAICLGAHQSLWPHLSLYCFLEGAALMVVAGLIDLGDSAIGSAIRSDLFRTGEKWSYAKYRDGSRLKTTLLVCGASLFILSFAIWI